MTLAGPVEEADIEAEQPGRKQKRRKISSGEGRLALALIAPTVILLGLVVGYPIVKAIYQSFLTDQGLTASGFFDQGNKWNGLTNY
jgi:ABC-type sugar transport system permease subunit